MRIGVGAAAVMAAILIWACETAGDAPQAEPSIAGPAALAPQPQESVVPPTEEERAFAAGFAERLSRARYMEQDCAPADYAGWEGLPLRLCSYEMSNADGAVRRARIIMLNPSPEKLAQWIFSSCRAIGKDNEPCRSRLFEHIRRQSGAQFPVAGVMLENFPDAAAYWSYTFREGVIVKLAGVPNGAKRQLTDAEIDLALSPATPVAASRVRARIASTTPDDYRANGGTQEVGTTAAPSLNWPAVAGGLYRTAWGSPENELMTAWARANQSRL